MPTPPTTPPPQTRRRPKVHRGPWAPVSSPRAGGTQLAPAVTPRGSEGWDPPGGRGSRLPHDPPGPGRGRRGGWLPGDPRSRARSGPARAGGGLRRRAGAGLTVRSSWVRSFMLPGVAAAPAAARRAPHARRPPCGCAAPARPRPGPRDPGPAPRPAPPHAPRPPGAQPGSASGGAAPCPHPRLCPLLGPGPGTSSSSLDDAQFLPGSGPRAAAPSLVPTFPCPNPFLTQPFSLVLDPPRSLPPQSLPSLGICWSLEAPRP